MWKRTTQNVKLVLHHGQNFGRIFLDKPNIAFIYTTSVWGDIYIFLTRLGIGLRPESMEAPKVSMRKAISVKMLKNSFEHMVIYWCKIHSMVIMILMYVKKIRWWQWRRSKRQKYLNKMMVFKLGNSVWSKVALFRKCWFSTEVLLVILMMTMIFDDVIMRMMRSSMINTIMMVLYMIEGLIEMLITRRMRNWRTKNILFTFSQFAASHPLNLGLLSSSPKVLGLKHHHYPER